MSESDADLLDRIEGIKNEIKSEYLQSHDKEWIVGFSGGKDSTLMLHLVIEALLELPSSLRSRKIHVLANDTLVESPIVASYVDKTLEHLSSAMKRMALPCSVEKTTPDEDHTFWVNLIGRGYPAPTRMFRWCTDRMKIRPTTGYIRRKVTEDGAVILLLGVRRSESSARAKSAKRYDNGGRLNRHNDIMGCYVFRPILDLATDDVWEFLMMEDPPWGGSHRDLVDLYRNAAGGECPVVLDPDAAPSCGSSSIRFGCWTCTVVEKDRSFRAAMEKGFEHLEPMADFRDWLKDFCYRDENRMTTRRNGNDGKGPLTFSARQTVLQAVLALQEQVGERLITEKEIARIEQIWREDETQLAVQKADRLLDMIGAAAT